MVKVYGTAGGSLVFYACQEVGNVFLGYFRDVFIPGKDPELVQYRCVGIGRLFRNISLADFAFAGKIF